MSELKLKNKKKFCPVLKDFCLEGNCAFWRWYGEDGEGKCAIVDISDGIDLIYDFVYSIYEMVKEISQQFKAHKSI